MIRSRLVRARAKRFCNGERPSNSDFVGDELGVEYGE